MHRLKSFSTLLLVICLSATHKTINVSCLTTESTNPKGTTEAPSTSLGTFNLTGECINNSIDAKCDQNHHYLKASRPQQQQQIRPSRESHIDNEEQLSQRLAQIDQLVIAADNPANLSNPQKKQDDQKSLRQVLLLHRHGDRCPIAFQSRDPLKDEPFWKFHGLGQLTNRGKARLYVLGKLIRQRYDDFMNNSVSKLSRISRSSGALRCIESAQVFLAGFLNLNQVKSSDAEQLVWDLNNNNPLAHLWQPASILAAPTKIDGMLAEGAHCSALTKEYETVIEHLPEIQSLKVKYKHEADVMFDVLNHKMDYFYKWYWGSSQIEVEKQYFESKLNKRIIDIYDRLEEAGNIALGSLQATVTARRLRSGLLINDIIQNMENFRTLHSSPMDYSSISSFDQKSFIHYSAHDITIIILLGMLEQWEKYPFRPDYASTLIFELHQDGQEWFVKLFYMPTVPMEPIELHLSRCEDGDEKKRCSLDKLTYLMRVYMIKDWQTWMKECRNTFHSVNPYAETH